MPTVDYYNNFVLKNGEEAVYGKLLTRKVIGCADMPRLYQRVIKRIGSNSTPAEIGEAMYQECKT